MKHVLLIANIDGNSPQLLRYAAKLCKDLKMKLHILQIEPIHETVLISSPYYMGKTGVAFDTDFQHKKTRLSNFVLEHTKDLIDSTWISNQLVQGNVQMCLNTFINKEKIDFVIASQTVFRNTEIGQNNVFTQLLLNISDVPTLVVPNDHAYRPFGAIGYLTTLIGNDFDHMVWVKDNFPKSKLMVLHFSIHETSPKEAKKVRYLKSELGEHSFTYENRAINIEDFIASEVKTVDNEFDCLMVKTKKRNFWQRLIDPSTALNLILRIDCPTLVFKFKEEDMT